MSEKPKKKLLPLIVDECAFKKIERVVSIDELGNAVQKAEDLLKLSGADDARHQLIMILSQKPNWNRKQLLETFYDWFNYYAQNKRGE